MITETIKFSHNWNGKLHCKCFTTIRVRNDQKYQVGTAYRIQLDEQEIGPGTIRAIHHITIAQLTDFMAYVDTGYCLEYAKKVLLTMYKNKGFNWETQQFSFMLIEMTEKTTILGNELLYGTYAEPAEITKPKQANLFAKS